MAESESAPISASASASSMSNVVDSIARDGEEHLNMQDTFGLFYIQPPTKQETAGTSQDLALSGLQVETLPPLSIHQPETTEATPDDPLSDISLGAVLGKGGWGEVYLAKQHSLQRDVALKRVHQAHRQNQNQASLLLREGVLMGFLEHPNIVPVHLLGRDEEGNPLLVMKRIEGVSWLALLEDETNPAWDALRENEEEPLQCHINILIEVCRALEFAHNKGVIHCDIKPENVMIGAFGEVYLLDWGIARLEEEGVEKANEKEKKRRLFGTPAYMAPEMLKGLFTKQTDVYLLGATLHEILTKQPRHLGASLGEVVVSILSTEDFAYPAKTPPDLAALCNAATAYAPEDRPPSIRAFRSRLIQHAQHRASHKLAQEAQERLDTLRAATANITAQTSAQHDIHRLSTECRFAFLQALREWKDNPTALTGLQACLELMIKRQLQEENLASAKVLLADLPTPNKSLEDEVEALQESISHKRTHELAYQQILHDRDANVSKTQRNIVAAAIVLFVVLIPTLFQHLLGYKALSYQLSTLTLSVITLGVGSLVFVMRRALFENELNRAFVSYLGLLILAVWGNRIHSLLDNVPALHALNKDLLVMACISLAFAYYRRAFLAIGTVFSVGFIVVIASPQLYKYVFVLTLLLNWFLYNKLFRNKAPKDPVTSKA